MGKDVVDLLHKRSSAIIRQLVQEADQMGVAEYLQYLFFLFIERPQNWPNMSEQNRKGLELLRAIMTGSGDTPTYTDGLQIPPPEMEISVDGTLVNLGGWGSRNFIVGVRREIERLSAKYIVELRKRLPKMDIDATFTELLFRGTVEKHPGLFPDSSLLLMLVNLL
jgi:hypothetical protein